jgi:hypothetical protein
LYFLGIAGRAGYLIARSKDQLFKPVIAVVTFIFKYWHIYLQSIRAIAAPAIIPSRTARPV